VYHKFHLVVIASTAEIGSAIQWGQDHLGCRGVVLTEHTNKGPNPRFVVTNLVGTELATAQADTIRLKLFKKIGAVVKASVRRLVLHLSSAYPLQSLFMQVCERLGAVLIMPVGKQMSG